MKAELFSVGTEILLGNIVDTNSQYIADTCANLGIQVYRMQTLGDNPKRLRHAFEEALTRVDMVIASGGLGPTTDDLTKEMAMEALGQTGVIHQETLDRLAMQFDHDVKRIANNEKQAIFPENAIVLKNSAGTAPGAVLRQDDKMIVLLPGPPHEMKTVFYEFKTWYAKTFSQEHLYSRTLRFTGIGESDVNAELKDLFAQENPSIAPYAKPGEVTLRITAYDSDRHTAIQRVDAAEAEVRARVGDYIYGTDDDTLEKTIVALAKSQGLTLATAESLTGGLVGAGFVLVPGASAVYQGSIVAYQDEHKEALLNVSRETLQTHSAVSEQCLIEMLDGICAATGANTAVATTGYAGPTGDQVGLVFVGVRINGKTVTKELHLHGERMQIIRRSVRQAQTLLWQQLKANVSRETSCNT